MLNNFSKSKIGWIQAFISVLFFWGVSNVFIAYSTQILQVNKVMFALSTYATCALCLLLYAGHGKLSKETMRSVDTWSYGIIMLLNYFVTINLFSLTTASEASLIQRFSVVFSVIICWFFLLQSPGKNQLLRITLIFLSILYILKHSPEDKIFYLYVLMILAGILQSLRIFIAELHRPHKAAAEDNSIKTRCRVIGYVMFVITLIFSFMVISATYLQEYIPEMYRVSFIIEFNDLFSYKSIICGAIMGMFIYTPLRYFEFSASEKIKTENYLAITSLSFFSTLAWEWATSGLTGLSVKNISFDIFLAGLLITLASLAMAISKMLRANKPQQLFEDNLIIETQNPLDVEETRAIIATSLEHFNGDINKTAKALGLNKNIISVILEDNKKVITFNKTTMQKTARLYRKNVAESDALTGLLNRNGFMTALKTASFEASNLSLFFIDLNKFKPVNDTHGHKAGDYILQNTGLRLQKLFPHKSLITRLGGDEYCILLLDINKKQAEELITTILQTIEEEFVYKNKKIAISGSIGLACYPEDTQNPEELIDLADNKMYVNKNER